MHLLQMFFFCSALSFFGHGFMADLKDDSKLRDLCISLGLLTVGVCVALLLRIKNLSVEDRFSLAAAVSVLWASGITGLLRANAKPPVKVDMLSVRSESGAPVRVPLLEKENTNVTAG